MGTNFPTDLDNFTNPTPTDYLDSPSHSSQHADANDAIEALQAKVGIDNSTVVTSHDYKISTLETNIQTGWVEEANIPTYVSTSNGVDTLNFAGVDLTGTYQKGDWAKISSGAGTDLIYKVKSVSYSTDTTMEVVGETSVSGTITDISFSKLDSPQGAIDWRIRFKAAGYRAADKNIADATFTSIEANSKRFDEENLINISGVFTAPVTGYYNVSCSVEIKGSTTGERILALYKNGVSYLRFERGGYGSSSNQNMTGSATIYLKRGDTVDTYAYQASGSTLLIGTTVSQHSFHFIGI